MYIGVVSMRYAKALLAYADDAKGKMLFMRKRILRKIVMRKSPSCGRLWIILYCLPKQS